MQSDSPSEKPGTVQFKGTPQSSVNDHQRHSDAIYGGTSSASTEVCDIPIFWSVPHHSALQHVFPCSLSQIWGDTPCLASPWSVSMSRGPERGGGGSQWGMGRDGKGAEWALQCTKTLVHSSTLETCSPGEPSPSPLKSSPHGAQTLAGPLKEAQEHVSVPWSRDDESWSAGTQRQLNLSCCNERGLLSQGGLIQQDHSSLRGAPFIYLVPPGCLCLLLSSDLLSSSFLWDCSWHSF